MKNYYTFFILFVCLFLAIQVNAQEPRYVTVSGYDLFNPVGNVGDYNNVLYDAILADTTGREENPNTIYLLKRNHIYPQGKIITNYFHLQIQGEDGDGYLPEIAVGLKTDGTTGNDFIDAYGDVTLKNVYFNGSEGGGAYLHRMIEMRAPNGRFVLDGVAMTGDNSGAVVLKADSLKVYVRNCVMGDMGYRYVMNGNGRFIEIRGEAPFVDTLIIENCLTYNLSDRVIRNEGSILNYCKIDHLTALNTVGRNGGIELSKARKASVTNCVLANVISIGHSDIHAAEQQQADHHFAAITLDTLFAGQEIVVRNNNIYWDKAIKDAWALYDTVEAPNYICATTKAAIGDANIATAYFDEPLVFNNVCGNLASFVANYYADPTNENLPDAWCVGGAGETGLYYDEIDVSYANSYVSYTADDDGKPVGCQLNFNFVGILDHSASSSMKVSCYPNPFKNITTLKVNLESASDVVIRVYNITGAQLFESASQYYNSGIQEITFDAGYLQSGQYFYQLETNEGTFGGKMIIIK